MSKGKPKVLVAMSGGVDSSVAVLLLKEQGYDVSGAYMRCWPEIREGIECTSPKDNLVALQIAAHLDIPFQTFNFEQEYRDIIFQYFLDEYKAGRTPNPDVLCNKHIKFGIFLKKAIEFGYDFIATGHYVKKIDDKLYKAVDSNKDQSYFLCQLTREQLKYALFPIGELTKPQVREIAREHGLFNADKKDSQGLCFVGHIELPKVLEKFMELKSGVIVDNRGEVMGEHTGLNGYTIGQRERVGIGGTGPWYVAGKDYKTNTLIVAKETDPILYKDTIRLININWVSGVEPKLPLEVDVKIRYRQPDVPAIVRVEEKGKSIEVNLKKPQRGVAEGQFLVFYQGDQLLGGGVMEGGYNSKIGLNFEAQAMVLK
ncbi:tRNA 2-thiouridine(34) synthase MnmA [Candidatus Parcubacteria bacterium]|nr:MAG: tRNA 2-thiouridine(34) synthase MnmA [Candidatus Parcubacteria bacterium]